MNVLGIPNFVIQVDGVDLEFKVRTFNFFELVLDIDVILLNPDGSESEVREGFSISTYDRVLVIREIYQMAKRLADGLYTEFHVGAKPYYYYD